MPENANVAGPAIGKANDVPAKEDSGAGAGTGTEVGNPLADLTGDSAGAVDAGAAVVVGAAGGTAAAVRNGFDTGLAVAVGSERLANGDSRVMGAPKVNGPLCTALVDDTAARKFDAGAPAAADRPPNGLDGAAIEPGAAPDGRGCRLFNVLKT